MSNRVGAFEDLEVFQRAYRLSLEVHRASLKFPRVEQHALGDQVEPRNPSVRTLRKASPSRVDLRRSSSGSC